MTNTFAQLIRTAAITRTVRAFAAAAAIVVALFVSASPASAQVAPVNPYPASASQTTDTTIAPIAIPKVNAPASEGGQPKGPQGPAGSANDPGNASVSLNINDALNKPSQSIVIIMLITVMSVAPALLIMTTSFTRVIIVLSLTRNAIGVQTIPPNQVLVGLALFISLFIMTPTLKAMNTEGIQPYLRGEMNQTQAFEATSKPLKAFMLKNTRQDELSLFARAASDKKPEKAEDVGLNALVPAFILSEIKTAFIIGFVVFIPFLVIDIIVSSSLMSMGMMMLPPQMISLPFKLLLFVLVDGWGLVVRSLLNSFN